ncbi:hypothetical protein [Streptacidiphilus neutrinimicus]|uniref:hypothetical protein n=1 Tax=Streptacidiphilus neutrinimicus TaxID=105420 RepID=UPI000B2D9751|nr:hypothetical protein [Streptacidiphilus neutrinimicus]
MGQQVMTVEEPRTGGSDVLSAFRPTAPHHRRPAPVVPAAADDADDADDVELNLYANCRISARFLM